MSTAELKVRQRWRFRCRPHEPEGLVTIYRLEDDVAHVAFADVRLFNGESIGTTVGHLPVSVAGLRSSVTEQIGDAVDEPDTFREGYEHWRAAKGGVFSVSLAEILDIVERSLSAPEPLLDHAIRTMRELRSDDAIHYALRTVLIQPTLSFIARPDDPSRPVLWQFDGHPPCIPVFTSEDRATQFIADANLGAPSFMTAPGNEAIDWMLTGLDDEVAYASLNAANELSLPVYFDMLRRVRDLGAD